MTGTRVSCRTVSAYAELLSVPAMEALMMEAMQEAEKPEYTDDDYEYAARFAADQASPSIDTAILPADQSINLGSTDVGDVSWQVPTGLISVAAEATGCALHTWQIVAQGKSPLAHKGMHYAARILFAAAKQLYSSPELCECIQADYQRIKGSRTYRSMLPDSVKPGDF